MDFQMPLLNHLTMLSPINMNIENLHEEHQHKDLLEHDNHQCGYQNNNVRTLMADEKNIKSTNMDTCLNANSKLTTKHEKL
jgi:hypothetical protein